MSRRAHALLDWPHLVRFGALASVLVAGACGTGRHEADASGRAGSGACACPEQGTPPLGAAVMAWLSKARSLHHAADLAEDRGALDEAARHLDALLAGPRPSQAAPEIDEVVADTCARLAELRSRQGSFEAGVADIDRGLAVVRDPNYFRGHLFEVLGLVRQRQAEALADRGRSAEADRARDEAIRASLEAVRIQDEVIQGALADAGREQDR